VRFSVREWKRGIYRLDVSLHGLLSMESALMIDKRVLQLVEKREKVSASINCGLRMDWSLLSW
jgi:hypothetical protein